MDYHVPWVFSAQSTVHSTHAARNTVGKVRCSNNLVLLLVVSDAELVPATPSTKPPHPDCSCDSQNKPAAAFLVAPRASAHWSRTRLESLQSGATSSSA